MPSVTIRRELAVQRWPGGVEGAVEQVAYLGDLEVGVVEDDHRVLAAHLKLELAHRPWIEASATRRPVFCDPVKADGADVGAVEEAPGRPSEPRPITRLRTPFGRPARWRMSTIAQVQPGTRSAGLMTTVLPQASAGAIFQAGIAIGKFQGATIRTGPIASRVNLDADARGGPRGRLSPVMRRVSPAKNSKICAARMVSPTPSARVLPSSRESRRPSSSLRAGYPVAAFSTSWRCKGPAAAPGREGGLGGGDGARGVLGGAAAHA